MLHQRMNKCVFDMFQHSNSSQSHYVPLATRTPVLVFPISKKVE